MSSADPPPGAWRSPTGPPGGHGGPPTWAGPTGGPPGPPPWAAPPGPPGPPPTWRRRPGAVTVALVLWILAVLVSIAGTVLYLVAVLSTSSSAGRTAATLPTSMLSVIGALVALALAFVMFAGRSWARVALTTIGALAIASSLTSVAGSVVSTSVLGDSTVYAGGLGVVLLIPLVRILVVVAAIVVSFLPSANRWFAAPLARW